VANVSFEDARSFCELLSKKESKTYVLPSKDEWLAATGLSAQDVANAWKVAIDRGWLDKEVTSWRGTVSVPSRVGSLGPQANGLCDVFGNVREWVAEGESAGFSYNSAAGRTKTLFLGANEALWILPATGIRCVMRAGN
jgi:formylglycine-generating enzyme required for sulfatase activity